MNGKTLPSVEYHRAKRRRASGTGSHWKLLGRVTFENSLKKNESVEMCLGFHEIDLRSQCIQESS